MKHVPSLVLAAALALLAWRQNATQAAIERLAARSSPAAVPAPSAIATRVITAAPAIDANTVDAIARRTAELAPSAPAPTPRPPTAAEEDAAAGARATLDAAAARGTLRKEDAMLLRAQLAQVNNPEVIDELRRQLAVAINRGNLVPEDPSTLP